MLSKADFDKAASYIDGLRRPPEAEAARATRPQSVGAAAEMREPLTVADALGLEKKIASWSPVTRLQQSRFELARGIVRDMSDAGLTYKENFEGVPTSIGGTIETRLKMRQGPLAEALDGLDEAYARYFASADNVSGLQKFSAPLRGEADRLSGGASGKMTFPEFKRAVSAAMIRGDEHVIPEVAEAARGFRSHVFDPMKDEAIRLGIFPENVEVKTARSYLTRVYDREAIIARRDEWNRTLEDYFKGARRGGGDELSRMSDAEISSLVDDVTNTILGESVSRLPGLSIVQGPRGPLKERVLNIPDEMIESFLERDIERVARIYNRSMSSDLELIAKFGRVDMEEQLARLLNEYNDISRKATSSAERQAIEKEYRAAKRDIEGLRDRARGVYALPSNPDGFAHRFAKTAMALNYISKLGNMTVAAVADPAKAVFRFGLMNTFKDGWLPFLQQTAAYKAAGREVRAAGTGTDMITDIRTHAMADTMDDFTRGGKFERAVEGVSSKFGLLSLMAPWNATQKQIVASVAIPELLRSVEAVTREGAKPKQIAMLAAGGVDKAMAKRILKAFSEDMGENGTGIVHEGMRMPNTANWKDRGAVEAFRALLVREVDNAIVSPGFEKPFWMSKQGYNLIGQFKGFAFASTQRTLLAGLQARDAQALQGALLMMALGALSRQMTALIKGEDTSEWNAAKWTAEAFDASGLGEILMEGNNLIEKVSRGQIGLSVLTGKEISRYQSRSAVSAVMGPTFGAVTDAVGLTGSALSAVLGDGSREDRWSASDTHTARQMVPFQNIFYLRHLFDQVEKGVNGAFGVPEKKQ